MDPSEGPPLHAILDALGDPARLAIVRMAARSGGELACGRFELDLPKATASRHFQVLREAGILSYRCSGTQRLHSLCRDEIDRRFPGLLDAVLRDESG